MHNYRWRLGLAEGESKYDKFDKQLAEAPIIMVPATTLEGDSMAHHLPKSAPMLKNSRENIHINHWGIGHNLPYAPKAFVGAIVDVEVTLNELPCLTQLK